jgi:hypothetical protein
VLATLFVLLVDSVARRPPQLPRRQRGRGSAIRTATLPRNGAPCDCAAVPPADVAARQAHDVKESDAESGAWPLWESIPYRFELTLFVLACITRYYGIWYPNSIVFDEIHFGGFVRDYDIGTYFFDIHPPLGKLTLLWLGNLLGYDAFHCDYWGDEAGLDYPPLCKFYILRWVTGALLPRWLAPRRWRRVGGM